MAVSSRPMRRMVVHEVEGVEVREPKSKPKRKWTRRFGFGLIVLAVLVWFLPMILAKTPLLGWAINRFGNLKGQVTIQSASLGWLSAPAISGIELRDDKNQPVVEHLSVAGSNSLFGLICHPSNLGSFQLDKPKLTLRLRSDGSNLEDVIANYMTGESSSKKIGVEVKITDAAVEIVDETSRRGWQMDQFSLDLKMPACDADPMIVETSCRMPDAQKPGKLKANISIPSSSNVLASNSSPKAETGKMINDVGLQIENFPLDILQPVLARCAVEARTSGWLGADIHTTLADQGNPDKTTVEGTVTTESFTFAMPALGKDSIRLTSLRADGKGSLSSAQIDLEQSSLVCDLGNAQLSGSLQLHDAAGQSNLTAAGLLRQRCEMSGRVDLARLAAMFPKWLHVREGTQITSGEVQASFSCRPQGNDPKATSLAWQGQVQALDFKASDNGRQIAWAKPFVAGFIAHDEPRGIVVETVQCDSDFLKITGGGTTDNLTASATFDLKQFADRLGQFIELSPYQFAGVGRLDAQLAVSTAGIRIPEAKIHVDQFTLASPSINLNEPQLNLAAAGSWITKQRRLNITSAVLTNSTMNVTAQDFTLSMPANGPLELGGTVQYRSNLAQLRQCFADRTAPSSWGIAGVMTGGAQFKQADGVIHCETNAEVANFIVADASGQQFQEPKIALAAVAEYDSKNNLVKINSATITSSLIAAYAASEAELKEQTVAHVNGQVNYDLNRISALLRPSFGNKVRFSGQGRERPITWRGPFSLDKGQATADLTWDSAYLFGFEIGPATIKPKLEGGVLSIEPMQVALSQGKLFLAPKVRVAPSPMELAMPPGMLAQQVQITPDMCELFLKYVSPVLAGVTEARGSFSIELANCRIPLSDPKQGDLAGKFIVHDVEIGPGPLIRELAVLMDRETPAKLRQQSVVEFQMYQGRIYHKNMELIFPDFSIQTKGSVGIDDQTLSVLAEMPIPPKWLVNNPAATALKNQTIAIPIGGTLAKPQLDRAKLEEYTRQFLRKAAGNMLEEGLNKGFDLLRQPRQ